MAKATKKKAAKKKTAPAKRKPAPAKAKAQPKAKAKPKTKAKSKPKKATAKVPVAPIVRLDRFAPAPKKPLALPVAATTSKPIRAESLRPRSWIERTLPSR